MRYTPDEQLYLVSIMEEFELLYDYAKGQWLVPDLLPKELENKPDWDETEAVVFIMDYDFLPPNVMSRFIIRMKTDVRDLAKLWRTGVVLESRSSNCSALVTADLDKQRIRISVNGAAHRKREYFSTIRHTLCDIHESLNLVISEKMPVPGFPNVEVDYEELLGYEAEGIDEYFSGKLRRKFSVSKDFLDKVSTKRERQKRDIHVNVYDTPEEWGEDLKHVRRTTDKMSGQMDTVLESLEKQLSLTQAQQQEVHAIYALLDKSEEEDAVFAKLDKLLEEKLNAVKDELPAEIVKAWKDATKKLPGDVENKVKVKTKLAMIYGFIPKFSQEYELEHTIDLASADGRPFFQRLGQDLKAVLGGEKQFKDLLVEPGAPQPKAGTLPSG
ncbi:MAG: hypothetical protein IPN76_19525 [Saprospiraceae bacterium]|nr:hypothetical protein [Saprospiraceae bacterium]